MSSATILAVTLAGLGISNSSFQTSTSSLTEDSDLSETIDLVSSQTELTPPASPSDDKVIYPRISRIEPRHIQELASWPGFEHIFVVTPKIKSGNVDTNDKGCDKAEDEGSKKQQSKRRYTRVARSVVIERHTSKSKKSKKHDDVGKGRSSGVRHRPVRRTAVVAHSAQSPKSYQGARGIGLGFDLPPSFFDQSVIQTMFIPQAPSSSLLPTPFVTHECHEAPSPSRLPTPFVSRKPWEAPSPSLLPTPFASYRTQGSRKAPGALSPYALPLPVHKPMTIPEAPSPSLLPTPFASHRLLGKQEGQRRLNYPKSPIATIGVGLGITIPDTFMHFPITLAHHRRQ
ncbi:hypothetical protein AcW1_008464 [Taiwanofungus camphoratus]|nr:hypothetical protein AcW1_008464 [Antrodia cinnamomea]